MDIWIGTAGYSYRDWVGAFYPPGTRGAQMLAYYSRHFPLVELNFTFYRTPTASILNRLADQTPAGCQFVVKLPQSLSHESNARDLAACREAVAALTARHQLLSLLCQLPQRVHHSSKAEHWLETLADAFSGLRLAVEFRHRSWSYPGLITWAEKADVDLVSVDAPDLPGLFPSGLIRAGSRVYVRMHSRQPANWYAGHAPRYDYSFPDSALNEWIDAISRGNDVDQAVFIFNNCYRHQAVDNARRLRALFALRTPDLHVVPPFAETPPLQRSLFDSSPPAC
jgi:uncharacterized protein YecE (DUF72 family)